MAERDARIRQKQLIAKDNRTDSVSLTLHRHERSNSMTTIETLASVHGRTLLRDIYRELRFERQVSALVTLTTLWRICTTERELIRMTKRDVVVLHPLGLLSGTALWMQEVVNRFFYSAVNAFVYFGASILLVAVGLNRTRVIETPGLVVGGVILEALLLLLLFVVMFFTPPEDLESASASSEQSAATEELLRELGEIGRDYAAMAVQLETIAGTLNDLVERQDTMIVQMRDGVEAAVSAVAPNPNLLHAMRDTTTSLENFTGSVDALGERLKAVEQQEVARLVRSELERILSRHILDRDERSSSAS
ncbi:MAG: hypothetical protein NTX15_04765 [Candidatus Kapabacteria bacterium]|nr:hypothetical protein [Candidatus Kapabacteria bacterium]